jgi:putative peptidoglycan lipid II flippase
MSDKSEQDHLVNTPSSGKQAQNQSASILKNALKMAFGTMASRILGLARESLFAALFDKHITDAWNVAFRVPNLFRRLLGEGSLSVSFIPVFIDADLESKHRSKNLINSLYTILLMVLALITTLGVLFPEIFLQFALDPAYIADTEKYMLTVHLAKIMFLFVFFISSFAFFMGILNSLGQFFWPAIAPTFWNLAMVISTVWPSRLMSDDFASRGDQLAWGVVVGGIFQAAVLIPSLMKSGYFPKLAIDFKNSDMHRVFKNMIPGFIGTGLLQFMTIINIRFSSSFPEGTISFINYIDRLIELPLSLISVSLGTALLPALSKLWTENNKIDVAKTSRKYLELNLFVSIAAAAGLFALAEPIIQLLFGRGKFSSKDVLVSAEILKTYCWIMIFVSGIRVLTPAYFAVKNTWFPMVASAMALVIHLILAPVLIAHFSVSGLMISTIFSAALNMISLLIFYRYFICEFEYGAFVWNVFKFSVAGVVVYFSALSFYFVNSYMPAGFFGLLVGLFVAIVMSLITFVMAAQVLKMSEIQNLLKRVLKR